MFADHLALFAFTISCIWSIVCRINQMNSTTPHSVFFKYAALALGLFTGLLLPQHRDLCLVLGITGYLMISAPYWKNGAPSEFRRRTDDRAPTEILKRPGPLERAWAWILKH